MCSAGVQIWVQIQIARGHIPICIESIPQFLDSEPDLYTEETRMENKVVEWL